MLTAPIASRWVRTSFYLRRVRALKKWCLLVVVVVSYVVAVPYTSSIQ